MELKRVLEGFSPTVGPVASSILTTISDAWIREEVVADCNREQSECIKEAKVSVALLWNRASQRTIVKSTIQPCRTPENSAAAMGSSVMSLDGELLRQVL